MAKERVQKIIARAGFTSRRGAEELIEQGEVTINGKVATLGESAEWGVDAIKVSGKLIHTLEDAQTVLFYKPRGVLCQLGEDAESRPTLSDYLKGVKMKLFPVGRLEFNEEGAILLTNQGPKAEELRLSRKVLRIYRIKTSQIPTQETLDRLARGGHVDGKKIIPHTVRLVERFRANAVLELSFLGFQSFDLREYFRRRGLLVEKIMKFGVGHLTAEGLAPGEYRRIAETEWDVLLNHPEIAEENLKRLERSGSAQPLEPEEVVPATASTKPGRRPVILPAIKIKTAADAEEIPDADEEEAADFGFAELPGEGFEEAAPPRITRAPRGARFGAAREGRGDKPAFGRAPTRDRAPRREGSERPAFGKSRFGDRSERPSGDRPAFGKKPFGARPGRGERGFGAAGKFGASDRPRRPARAESSGEGVIIPAQNDPIERAPRGEGRPAFGKKPFGDRAERAPRADRGDRAPRGEGRGGWGERSERSGPRAPRADRSFGERPAFGKKPFGERAERSPSGNRSFGSGGKFSERSGPPVERSRRPSRPEGGEGFGAARPARTFGERSERSDSRPDSRAPRAGSFGGRTAGVRQEALRRKTGIIRREARQERRRWIEDPRAQDRSGLV